MMRLRSYFFSDARRTLQSVLGFVWALDGALQLQPFMYGKGFITTLTGMAPDQPHWLASSLLWGARTMAQHQGPYNTMAALLQLGIGLGLLYRPTVKQALIVSFVWGLAVWWFGEAFGMLLMNMASPLTGAPGGVLLYVLLGALVWPNERPGGLLGVYGARIVWAQLWVLMGALWLTAVNSSANAVSGLIGTAPGGAAWLTGLQHGLIDASRGHGLPIAVVLAAISIAIGLAVGFGVKPRLFLGLAIALNLVYWVVGQGLGGIFTGQATDPNAGPLYILIAAALYSLVPYPARVPRSETAALPGATAALPGSTASGSTAPAAG